MNRKFINEQEQKIILQYIGGESSKNIADVLNTSDVTVRNILTRHNILRKRTRKLSLDQKNKIVGLYEQGKSSAAIAQLFPLSYKGYQEPSTHPKCSYEG